MTRARARTLVTSTVAVVVAAAGLTLSTPAAPAFAASASLSVTSSRPIVGEQFAASGRVSTGFRRPVTLRLRTGSTWKNLRHSHTTRTGTYRFAGLRATSPRRLSVVAPRVRHQGRRYPALATAVRTLSPVRQTASLKVLPQIAQRFADSRQLSKAGAAMGDLVARFSPARPGRRVVFSKQLADGSWAVRATTTQRADGSAYWFGSTKSAGEPISFRATTVASNGAPAVTSEADQNGWEEKFLDQFSGTPLDPDEPDRTKWGHRAGPSPTRTKSENDADSVSVRDGTLQLQVRRPAPGSALFRTSQLSTQGLFSFRYGVASARVKFPLGPGEHGAFWLQSPSYGQHPGNSRMSGSEVDVVEFFGNSGDLGNFLYYRDGAGENVRNGGVAKAARGLIAPTDRWWNSYHVFSLEWTPRRYVFYVDGRQLYTTTQAMSDTEEFLILSLLSSDYEIPSLDRSQLPNTMYVDWARVWQRTAS